MVAKFTGMLLVTVFIISCSSQKKISEQAISNTDQLRAHIAYLSSDSLEGRRTGTRGEELAMNYITEQFRSIGLQPKGTEYYLQSFIVNDGKKIDPITEFSINGETLSLNNDYFIFPFSPDQYLEALPAIAVQEIGVPWFIDLKDILEDNKANPHFDLVNWIGTKYRNFSEKGANALIFYNSSSIDDKLAFDPKDKTEKFPIPVVYLKDQAAKKYLADKSATLKIKLRTGISVMNRIGHNVIGYIDNKAPNTIILGAHYDHLGYGEDGNSRNTGNSRAIHNGADDNASGTAALIELGQKLKSAGPKNNNYLFIAFSGEELGLYGSKYFTDNPTIDLKMVNYMINMDMIGRLNDSSKTLTIGGYGTSPGWSSVIKTEFFPTTDELKKSNPALHIKIDSSGTGPSDHTSFYRKDIPVLFYFTGLHADYHKPGDDADKINYNGEETVISHIMYVISSLDQQPRLSFLKTRETQTTTSARFSVSMGIMPDYTYSGTGVRADGVSEGKPAQKAGLKGGDIIIQLGDVTINSLENYMQALGTFKKGDRAKLKYKRGNDILETTVEF